MAFERMGQGPLDYNPVRYAGSKLTFRGPVRDLTGDYIACLGGTETYGLFIEQPFVALLDQYVGLPCVNLGLPNAGVDAFYRDDGIVSIARRARLRVLQLPGAVNLSNPFYTVHPRRNDRFVKARARLRRLYPEVDFTEFHFTRHLIGRLIRIAPERFTPLQSALQEVWVARLQAMLKRFDGPTILLWISRHSPDVDDSSVGAVYDPAFISRAMLDTVCTSGVDLVEVVISRDACAQGTCGMRYAPMQKVAATELPGPLAHQEVVNALLPVTRNLLS